MNLQQLEQFRHLGKEIKMLERRIADYESRQDSYVSDSVVGSSQCIPFQPHTITIKGYGDQFQARINALHVKYISRKIDLCKQLVEIECFIDTLQDSWLRQIIEYRYIKGMSWNVVAKNVYGYPNGNTARMAIIRFFEKY